MPHFRRESAKRYPALLSAIASGSAAECKDAGNSVFEEALEDVSEFVSVMSREPGVWQIGWPDIPFWARVAQRSPGWDEKLLDWPVGETLVGGGARDFTRIGLLLEALRDQVLTAAACYAPQTWVNSEDIISRTEFYEEQGSLAVEAQMRILEKWTPESGVSQFD